jgi:excisionase family DNA binding protein
MADMENRLLSADEMGKYLGVSSDTVYCWIGKRTMHGNRMSRLWKIKKELMDDCVKAAGEMDRRIRIKPNEQEERK